MKSYIIGIAGELGSGKDTFASMINYIIGEGTTKAKFETWLTGQKKWDAKYKHRITHFADPLKDCLSVMYNIPREYFDDRDYKDNKWFIINGNRFISDRDVNLGHCYKVTNDLLTEYSLNQLVTLHNKYSIAIKIRTLMQYFGTEVVRDMMGADLWTNATISKAVDIAESYRVCIIPDVRFINEQARIKGNPLYGLDILIKRGNHDDTKHSSETIDFNCTFPIQNNTTKQSLFYKALGLVNHMLEK